MRWLFLLVLVLNISYVLWQLSQPVDDLYADVSALHSVETIVLMRELGGDEAAKMATGDDIEVMDASAETEASAALVDIAVQSKQCFTLGPFRQKSVLQSLKKDIKPYMTDVRIRNREEKDHTVHWVFIQPEKSRKEVIALSKRLKAKKIKDFYIVREGEKLNGISLGHFRDKARAFGLQAKVKKLGFDVHVEPVFKTFEVFWLDYQLLDGEIPSSLINKYSPASGLEKVGRLGRECGA